MLNSKSSRWRCNSYSHVQKPFNTTPTSITVPYAYTLKDHSHLELYPPWEVVLQVIVCLEHIISWELGPHTHTLDYAHLGSTATLELHPHWNYTHLGTTPTLESHPPWDHTHFGTTPTLGLHPPLDSTQLAGILTLQHSPPWGDTHLDIRAISYQFLPTLGPHPHSP